MMLVVRGVSVVLPCWGDHKLTATAALRLASSDEADSCLLLSVALVTQVRRLICASLVRLYSAGDALPMYARVAALQGFLASKEAQSKAIPEAARVGALQCLAALCSAHGRALASGMQESLNLAVKHSAK